MLLRDRNSDSSAIGSPAKQQLDAMYGALAARIDALPSTHLAPGRSPGTTQ
jgi:hypothetical protein